MDTTARTAIVARLVSIFNRCEELRSDEPEREFGAAELVDVALRGRMVSIDSTSAALNFAATAIGETIAALSGFSALTAVFDAFEEQAGEIGASWLDHCWNGVEAGGTYWAS